MTGGDRGDRVRGGKRQGSFPTGFADTKETATIPTYTGEGKVNEGKSAPRSG